VEIPRPQFHNMQFIHTRGRLGFYKTIRQHGAQYGLQVKAYGPRRPALSTAMWTLQEADETAPVPAPRLVRPVIVNGPVNGELSPVSIVPVVAAQQPPRPAPPPPETEIAPDYPGYDPAESYNHNSIGTVVPVQSSPTPPPPEILIEKL